MRSEDKIQELEQEIKSLINELKEASFSRYDEIDFAISRKTKELFELKKEIYIQNNDVESWKEALKKTELSVYMWIESEGIFEEVFQALRERRNLSKN